MTTSILDSLDIHVLNTPISLLDYREPDSLFSHPAAQRIAAGLRLLVEAVSESGIQVEKIDRLFIERVLLYLDQKISSQLDLIIHHKDFKGLEQAWRSVSYLVNNADYSKNIQIELLECTSEEALEDFEDAPSVVQSGLYKQIYVDEYDMPGGEPYGAIIGDWEFTSEEESLKLLQNISKVAASAHCPFISSVGAKFFAKDSVQELPRIEDLEHYMERVEFLKWRTYRKSEDARYVGLTLPRFLLRKPWDTRKDRGASFCYVESAKPAHKESFLWGNAAFAFARNMVQSFEQNGWCVQIRGPESGGKVADLPIHLFDAGRGMESMLPTEILIPETREYEFSKQGFIPLSYYKNRDYACFFSAATTQKPTEYSNVEATANSRINARLPYLFLTSRIAHYLKVIQRETIGAAKSPEQLEQELNNWLKGLVTQMQNPGPELVATHPLHHAAVAVSPSEENPGFFHVQLNLVPHFQVEGVDVSLSLVSKMPAAKA